MTVAIIVQVRMASIRLTGNILNTVLDKTLLEYQIERLRRVKNADLLIIATPDHDEAQPVVELCERLGVACFRGFESNVLERYYKAATEHRADAVVRVTSDCPLIDPDVVERVIEYYLKHRDKVDYVSNTFPVLTYPRGMEAETFSCHVLQEANQEALDQLEREHVTLYIKRRPEWYRIRNLAYHVDASRYRWIVETPEDFELVSRLLTDLIPRKPQFTMEDCLQVMIKHPDWERINAGVMQKSVK